MGLVLVRTEPRTIARASPLRRLDVVRIISVGIHTRRSGALDEVQNESKTSLRARRGDDPRNGSSISDVYLS